MAPLLLIHFQRGYTAFDSTSNFSVRLSTFVMYVRANLVSSLQLNINGMDVAAKCSNRNELQMTVMQI
jgi:hypothetical protein